MRKEELVMIMTMISWDLFGCIALCCEGWDRGHGMGVG
jgi:hypothetical protein